MKRLLGCVPYLNARPLLAGLPPDFEVREAPPAELAGRFAAGEFEAALVPIIDAFRNPAARIVPGTAIAARGDVLSVRLFLRRPLAETQTIARDPASHTSNTLLEVLSRLHWKRPLPPPAAGAPLDGRLVIGDAALRELSTPGPQVDLGGAWTAMTGLPFVFAAWLTLKPQPGLREALAASARIGLAKRDEIADAEAPKRNLPAELCRNYLHDNIRFDLGDVEIRGAEEFWRHAASLDLAPTAGPLRFA